MAKRLDAGDTIRLEVKVAAGASRDAIRGWQGDCLRVSLVTAPERGKANVALIALLARALAIPKSAIAIVRGEHSARKTLTVTGLSGVSIRSQLEHEPPSA
jgi:uncharacterized protein YggU (UPF0235/DUF167 family)